MKKSRLKTLLLVAGLLVSFAGKANAATVGYIDYGKVQQNYPLAQQAIKELDAKSLELQQYMIDKEKQYKTLDTPLKKQNFEDMTAREFKTKQEALAKLRMEKDELIYNKIQTATRQVLVEQKLDAILDNRVIFVGGVDVSDLVIQKLKTLK